MNANHKLQAVKRLIEVAASSIAMLSPSDRADVYEGIAVAVGPLDEALRDEAQAICDALREAETRQMTFAALLRPNPEKHEPQNTRHHE